MQFKLLNPSQIDGVKRISVFYAFGILILAFVALQPWVEIPTLTRDAVTISGGKFYYGLLSNIGILLWCAAATICLLTYFLLKKLKPEFSNKFFLNAGMLSFFLLFDDLFMLHETVFPSYLHIKEKIIEAIYPFWLFIFLVQYREKILSTEYLVFLSALGFLSLSMFIDVLVKSDSQLEYLFEDGFKFLGIMGWCYYFTRTAFFSLTNATSVSHTIDSKGNLAVQAVAV